MATDVTGVEDVMGEVAHFWQLRKFQFIEEATDFWMNAVAPKECFGDEDPDLDTTLLLNKFFTEWLLFEMPYQESACSDRNSCRPYHPVPLLRTA